MLNFHFCRSFDNSIKNHPQGEVIRCKILEKSKRTDLRNGGSISCFGKIFVINTNTPKTKIIVQAEDIEIAKTKIKVHFVREIVFGRNLEFSFGKIIYPKIKSGEWHKQNILSQTDVNDFINEYERSLASSHNKQHPPSELTEWLKDYNLNIKYDIFEGEDWVKYTLNDDNTEGMQDTDVKTFSYLLSDVVDGKNGYTSELIFSKNDLEIFAVTKYDVGLIYFKIQKDNEFHYFLVNGANLSKQKEYWEKQKTVIPQYLKDGVENIEDMNRLAYRAYPKWTINNPEKWFAIQKNHETSNLSLTREQIQFFKDFKFPYYINGQAGSGKSTMLYYLFSNAYYYKCTGDFDGEIIFLTENKKLLDLTKNAVFDLLTNNPEFDGLSLDQRTNSEKCFASFKDFLLGLLSIEERKEFSDDKYLHFSLFKDLYENSTIPNHIKKKYSAEESWFTIITFIYGYESHKTITSEEYHSNVHSKSQKIPKETFEGIEKFVLPYYQKLLENGYWDKLKIIRYIEQNIDIDSNNTLVICDEAQDFCRVELRFILRLSRYLNYDLSKIEQVPLVFAGDPNQTVNPTGFREREMTEMLHKELSDEAKFNYDKDSSVYNPTYNYRSSQSVVGLANFIQFYRKQHLGIRLVKPQVAKRPSRDTTPSNYFFSYEELKTNQNLKNNLIDNVKYKIFIVPVDHHEKENYKEKNDFLNFVSDLEIKTSVEAKGAEYQQVVLFGFGEYFLNNFKSLTDPIKDNEFKMTYFFNKLYVGITRAQSELIIIDSNQSIVSFWDVLINNPSIQNSNWWDELVSIKNNIIQYNPGSISSLIPSTPEVALDNARKDMDQGLYDNHSSRLIVAGDQFFKIGHKKEGYFCYGKAKECLGEYFEAANYYLKYKEYNLAIEAYFKGKHFDEISKLKDIVKADFKIDVIYTVSSIMSGGKLLASQIRKLFKSIDVLRDLTSLINWRDDLLKELVLVTTNTDDSDEKRNLIEILDSLAFDSEEEILNVIAKSLYDLRHWERAIDIWDRINSYDSIYYILSKIECAKVDNDIEGEIKWNGELVIISDNKEEQYKINNKIIRYYNENIEEVRDPIALEFVYSALISTNKISDIHNLGQEIEKAFEQNSDHLEKFYERKLKEDDLEYHTVIFLISRLSKSKLRINPNVNDWLEQVNKIYQSHTESHRKKYEPYSVEEIEQIPDYPQKFSLTPPTKFNNINVKNFRKFKELSINNVGQFNLIVGDNNVGKTSLLEAFLFTSNFEEYIKRLAYAFTDRINASRYIEDGGVEKYSIETDFLTDYFFNSETESSIDFILQNNRNQWEFNLKLENSEFDYENYKLKVRSQNNNIKVDISKVIDNLKPNEIILRPLVSFGKGYNRDLANAYFYNIENNKSTRETFIDNMKLFIPNIERIAANPRDGVILIEESTSSESFPLYRYGEGAIKLFRILVQLTVQKGRVLLIDEIDAGIHFSHFEKFWGIILKVAKKMNVQLIATSHNLECIQYFKNFIENEPDDRFKSCSRVISLHQFEDGLIECFTRPFDDFQYALDNNLELRGENI